MSQITLTLPDELLENRPHAQTPDHWALELILCQLYQEGQITTGYAASLLGVSRMAFMDILFRRNIPYFDLTADELDSDLENALRAAESVDRENRQ